MNWQDLLRRPLLPRPGADACADVRPLLSLMSDGMASLSEVRRAEAHLQTCADCRQAHLWMEATHKAIVARPPILPPADMRARIALAIAASAETSLPAVPIALPPAAHRTLRLRPAYAAAASLAVAGAFLGHYLLTTPGQTTAVAPISFTRTGTSHTLPGNAPVSAKPGRTLAQTHRAASPLVNNHAPVLANVPSAFRLPKPAVVLSPGLMAFVPPRPAPSDTVPAPVTPQIAPKTALRPALPNRVAVRPAPELALPAPARLGTGGPKIATLPRPSVPQVSSPVLTAPPPAPVPAAPETTTVASRVPDAPPPVPARAVPGDALSSVRVSLTGFHADHYAHQLTMANGVHLRPNYVPVPITWTPTNLPEQNAPPRRASVASHPSQAASPSATLVSDTTPPAASDQRRSERDKTWTEAFVPSGT